VPVYGSAPDELLPGGGRPVARGRPRRGSTAPARITGLLPGRRYSRRVPDARRTGCQVRGEPPRGAPHCDDRAVACRVPGSGRQWAGADEPNTETGMTPPPPAGRRRLRLPPRRGVVGAPAGVGFEVGRPGGRVCASALRARCVGALAGPLLG